MNGMGAGLFADVLPVWRPDGGAISVLTDIGVVAQYYAGKVSGVFRARITTPVTRGIVTVWPLVGVLIGNANAALEPVVRYRSSRESKRKAFSFPGGRAR